MAYQKNDQVKKYSGNVSNTYSGCSYEKEIEQLVSVVEETLNKISDKANVVWTEYDNVIDLKSKINKRLKYLKRGDLQQLELLKIDFLPTATFQEIALSNDWEDSYLKLANKFDNLYSKIINNVEFVILHQSEGEKNAYFKKIRKLWEILIKLISPH